MGLCATDWKNLQAIAAQAYGSGWFEKSNGGEGYMGLIKEECGKAVDGKNGIGKEECGKAVDGEKGTDKEEGGKIRVFKCLTHRGERSRYKGGRNFDIGTSLRAASGELKKELVHLAKLVGMGEPSINALFREETGLLSRKIVAKVVTEIVRKGNPTDRFGNILTVDQFWRDVAHVGTVQNTMPGKSEDERDSKLVFNENHAASMRDLGGEELLSVFKFSKMPKTFDEMRTRFSTGEIGDAFYSEIKDSIGSARSLLPKLKVDDGVLPIFNDLLSEFLYSLTTQDDEERAFGQVRFAPFDENKSEVNLEDEDSVKKYSYRALYAKSMEHVLDEYEKTFPFLKTSQNPLDLTSDKGQKIFRLLLRKAMLSALVKVIAIQVSLKLRGDLSLTGYLNTMKERTLDGLLEETSAVIDRGLSEGLDEVYDAAFSRGNSAYGSEKKIYAVKQGLDGVYDRGETVTDSGNWEPPFDLEEKDKSWLGAYVEQLVEHVVEGEAFAGCSRDGINVRSVIEVIDGMIFMQPVSC